jgi:hypothetical protein
VATSSEPEFVQSSIYRISKTYTTISDVSFTAEPVTVDMDAVYRINFKTGSNGRLLGGESSITLKFDQGIRLSQSVSAYDSSYILINGIGHTLPPENMDISGSYISFIVPNNVFIHNYDDVQIILQGRQGSNPIRNPQKAGSYRIWIQTSVEEKPINSGPAPISDIPAVSDVRLIVDTQMVNAKFTASLSFRIQRTLSEQNGTITLNFPQYTLIPPNVPTSSILITHGGQRSGEIIHPRSVSTNQDARIMTIAVPFTILRGEEIELQISSDAGFECPSIPGSYFMNVRTSAQEIAAKSNPFVLKRTDTEIVNLSVNIVPNTPGAFSRVSYQFTTGSRGRLISGQSEISLILPPGAQFTQGVPALSKVTVNGISAHKLRLKNRMRPTQPDTLIITVPQTVTIGNETDVAVVVDSASGFKNASTTATLAYQSFTSVETRIQKHDYSLPIQLISFTAESRSGYIVLEWETENQLEEAQWLIERKKISALEYESIQKGEKNIEILGDPFNILSYLGANEGSGTPLRYSYVDSLVELGAVYAYRLADENDNGRINYHGIVYKDVTPAAEMILYKNIPNPFKSSTMIRYFLPEESEIELKIYDLVGKEIRSLTDRLEKSGYHEISWNAANNSGNAVASGMYVVSLRAKGVRTDKEYMQLLKILLVR